MSVERRGTGWRVRVRQRGAYLTATLPSRAEAEEWQARAVLSLARGEAPPEPPRPEPVPAVAEPLTLEQAAREWVAGALSGVVKARRGRRYGRRSLETHESRLRLHVLPHLGALPVTALAPGVLRRWLEALEAEASASTARLAYDSLRVVMRRLVEHELVVANACDGVRAPSAERVRPLRFLEPWEAERLRAVARQDSRPAIAAAIDLGLACGARHAELRGLRWGADGLDMQERVVAVTCQLTEQGEVVRPKGGRSRVVPIGPQVAARMREHRMAEGRPADGERVFPFDLRPPWQRVRASAGLGAPSPTIHSLRHTAATWWLSAGLTVHAVADLLGHADPQLVLRLYGHALPSERSTAGERLEAFLEAADRG